MAEKIKYIVKMEGKTPALFLPERGATYGRIVCYVHEGQHSEADTSYFKSLRNPGPDAPWLEINALIREYRRLGGIPCEMVQVYRDSRKLRAERWA